MTGFTKLFSSIVDSTIWREDDKTRIVWITMLAKADRGGRVMVSVPGLADAARVSLDECLQAIARLSGPDKWSRSKEFEGRRIEEMDGGFRLLNYVKYRELRSSEERRTQVREAVAKHRAKRANVIKTVINPGIVSQGKPLKAHAEAEAESRREDQIPPGGATSRAQDYIAIWCEEWKACYRDGYKVLPADAGAVGSMLKGWPSLTPDAWRGICRSAIRSGRRTSLGVVARNPNEFTGPKTPARGVQTTQDLQVAAAQRFLDRHEEEP